MYILGVSCYYHDAAAALIHDGILIAAADEERFSRVKHDPSFPVQAIHFCLEQAGITVQDVDYVVFYEKPLLKFERILMTTLQTFPKSWRTFPEAMLATFNEKLWIKGRLQRELGIAHDRLLFVEHHLSHAASAFFCSPYEEAAILTCDGVGEWATTTLGQATADWDGLGRNQIDLFQEARFPHSLGLLYSAFTAYLGFEVNSGEYKVMGMAPYGEPKYVDKIYQLITVAQNGSFQLDMDYFSFHHSLTSTFSRKFVDLFGPPRVHESEFFTRLTHPNRTGAKADENQYYADIAASIQYITEEILVKIAQHLHERTGMTKLCMAGGVALNSVANHRILTETPFQEIYIQPAAGDSGGAVGAALYVYHVLLGQSRRFVMEHCYWGKAYGEDVIAPAVEASGFQYTRIDDDDKLTDRVVANLSTGKVVGWYQGRFEWGPRALGNRSILADPRRSDMKDTVNVKIKFREPFRPFAPVILEEHASDFFMLECPELQYPARFMLMVAPIVAEKQALIPAVTHVNGSGRLQTLRAEWNPRYYALVQKFGQATDVPVLLNTSFNLRSEPIVNTPQNALNTFRQSGLDLLVLENYIVTKEG